MSKISLRAYNREIETLIERGHTEEAIAHCKYILKTYPKHLDTYRLLGKAFLESQRYGEAADILTRILSVLPDDFVAQIGMSIIREDEGNLDAAIFHMERSFEIQPSNAAIQDELRRLYGRRDGIEPPKLRLTRGALVRMYARGDLYRQAIAEARAAVKEDPQRLDLEIVLARMYYQTGQKAEAAELCSRLVTKLPYCMEANRILADVLPETSRSEDAKIYQQRLVALEPYLAYLSGPTQNIQQIPENAVSLDRLEWIPSLESSQQPAWANNLGVEIEEKEVEQMPDWLSALSEEKEATLTEEGTVQPLVPDQEAYQAAFTSSGPDKPETAPLTPEEQLPGFDEASQEEQLEPKEEIPEWMQELGETTAAPTEEKLPDWMQDLEEIQAAPAEEKLPEWMKESGWEISEHPSEEISAGVVSDEAEETAVAPAEIPEWLKDLAPTSQEDVLPEIPVLPVEELTGEDAGIPAQELTMDEGLPDWLKSPEPGVEEITTSQSQEPIPDWLSETKENLDELPVTSIYQEDITGAVEQSIVETQPSAAELDTNAVDAAQEEIISAVSEENISQPASGLENMDDAMAWLESLAAKQGADEETLLTKPEERLEAPPDWVAQATTSIPTPIIGLGEEPISSEVVEQKAELEETAPTIETVEELVSPEVVEPKAELEETLPTIAMVDELVSPEVFEQKAELEEGTQATAPEAQVETPQIPEGIQGPLGEELPVSAAENVPVETVSDVASVSAETSDQTDMDSAFAWLESLAAKQGAEPESLLVSAEERLENPPDWIQQETPKIVSEIEQEAVQQAPTEIGEGISEELPEWIRPTEEVETPAAEFPALEEALPDWLHGETVTQTPSEEITPPAIEEINAAVLSQEPAISAEPETDWIKEPDLIESRGEETSAQPMIEPVEEIEELAPEGGTPVASGESEPLPDWLTSELSEVSTGLEQTAEPESEPQALPDWLRAETPLPDVTPVDSSQVTEEGAPPLPDWLKDLEAEQVEEPLPLESEFKVAPVDTQQTVEISQQPDEMINQAQTALGKGQVDFALSIYQRLIDQDQKMDETIHDLRDALYRFPVDSIIWQTLGDAYMRTNRVQEALDAFTKAEELLK